ncbi:MAG: LysR family transcriptional regulator [Parvibaculum sp.]|uniref:LysR family transcriptional regulator n=1 Tax=Parvibaculum sp. TaxID=2024848 RepID=UPI0025D44B41|nr:LysR family transcriptional regulator [Parvibaculum sp.]MCE9651051.1 LysR family transcriptional regulator [Parvibaculum sp.]
MDRLDVLQLFVRVADTGSFSKAARALGVGQPTVSKQIAGLEARLGAQLLRRTTRGLSVTEAGQDFYDAAVRLLGDFEAAESCVGRGQASPSGTIRVAISAGFGRMFVVPRLPEFFARFPGVSVDLDISERHVNLIEESIDVAIRIGRLSDSGLLARRIGSVETVTVASPDYLERCGEPKTPDDLAGHASVVFLFRGAPRAWDFRTPSGPLTVIPRGPVRVNDAEHIRAAVRAGLGIGHSPSWLFASDIASGAVTHLLRDFAPDPLPIHAISPGRLIPGKVKVFIDFLAQVCAEEPTLRIR